ncbi:DUF6166 domain-containing protein [Ancylobacter mangrovi]|uniref:DUF6166 domain-containing protein n=1 Tax=Ancylobacter mangrovi TaxID=2972472 RepID=A0A9X2PP26_9HYPH|nr:DUF6166 domain-containing protein [Ancylobacter mangrovi]MCS0497233.1 DUF6166 domain-containing protein [Ancylobacter mangrovi]MCS0505058.1 DUF6166 domain-containing protein [Ancylobacter mangrovi]
MKNYRGDRTIDGVAVTVDGAPLPERTDLLEISRDGFEWSYEGHAPAQLAFAMLVDHFGNPTLAKSHYERFMRDVVANFGNEWEYTSADIDAALGAVAA